jgi:hypothetical protein
MNPTQSDIEARDQFIVEWSNIRESILPEHLFDAANSFYDQACKMGAGGWDGTSQLEKDGRINQDLDT